MRSIFRIGWIVIVCAPPALSGELQVVSTTPTARSLTASKATSISVRFDRPVDRATIVARRSFWAFGRWSGPVDGTYAYSDGDQVVTLVPDQLLSSGEQVMVILSHDIQSTTGEPLRDGGYSFQFWTRTIPGTIDLVPVEQMSARTNPNVRVRVYGGFATDLNRDGYLDITTVNEDSADIRVFLNEATGTTGFHDFLEPPAPIAFRASPSEPMDFNADGLADACTANIGAASVSVLIGNGDGTFQPQQLISVGVDPRGIAVLDVDGDGDTDIVNTNYTTDNLSLMINDGNGVFGPPSFLSVGGNGQRALAAEDMNNDGLLDLVVGTYDAPVSIRVHTANGDGTFTEQPSQNASGSPWMLVCGDLNNDGNADVAHAGSSNNRAVFLLGNGDGTLQPPQTLPADALPIATDIGDLDGDGDLDWIISSFLGNWRLYTNNGDGSFAHTHTFPAPTAASDTLMMDFENDGDLDVVLMDEIDDILILMENRGGSAVPTVSQWSLLVMVLAILTAGALAIRKPRRAAR